MIQTNEEREREAWYVMAVMLFAAFAAFFVKGMAGFANTLVFTSVLGFSQQSRLITPVDLLLGIPSNFYLVVRERKQLLPKVVVPLSILVVAGLILGALFLKSGQDALLKVILGLAVTVLGVEMFFRVRSKKVRRQRAWVLAVIGVFSGVMAGLFGIGAFLVAYISRTTQNQPQLIGNISCVFLVENICRIFLYWGSGLLTVQTVKTALVLLPAMALGLFLGLAAAKRVSETVVQWVVLLLLTLSGVSLVLKNLPLALIGILQ